MSNLSDWRYQNTLNDLHDCHEDMDTIPEGAEECLARERLIVLCGMIADQYGEEAA